MYNLSFKKNRFNTSTNNRTSIFGNYPNIVEKRFAF